MSTTTWPPPLNPPYPAYRGLRYEEEYALECMLSGVTVPNAQGRALPVNVFWKDPMRELHKMTYPAIMLEFLDLVPRRSEEHRGIIPFWTEPYTGNWLPNGEYIMGEFPLPVTLYYQASIYSRTQQHDVILNDMAATSWFPMRYGQLNCASGTCRRLDFEAMVNRDTIDANQQRVFCKVWSFSVDAEIVPSQWPLGTPVTNVKITVTDTVSGESDPSITQALS